MNGSYGIIGIVLGIALASWLQRRRGDQKASRLRNLAETVLIAGVAGIAAFSARYGVRHLEAYFRTDSYIDRSLAQAKKLPLIRRLIEDVPGAEQTIREALKQDRGAGSSDASFKAIASLRTQYAMPAFRAADDQKILAMWQANGRVMRWLAENDVPRCAEFFSRGLQEPDKLGSEFMVHFNNLLVATEVAYDNGRGKPAREVVDDEVLGTIIIDDFGMDEESILAVLEPANADPRTLCGVGLLWSDEIERVPFERRVPFVRRLLSTPS